MADSDWIWGEEHPGPTVGFEGLGPLDIPLVVLGFGRTAEDRPCFLSLWHPRFARELTRLEREDLEKHLIRASKVMACAFARAMEKLEAEQLGCN